MTVNFIPEGYHTVTPYLTVRGETTLTQSVRSPRASSAQAEETAPPRAHR